MKTPSVSPVRWQPCYRIIPSRFPPIELFEQVADPEDLEAIFAIEAMTNDRLREEVGELQFVPPEDRVSGPASSPIMAAFTHLNPEGDRFTDGSFGVFYAGGSLETAVAETRFHRAHFLAATDEPPQEVDMRPMRESHPAYYHPTSYAMSQELAAALRDDGSDGIVYSSVRHEGGECAAVFRPRLLSNCRQERHLCYVWNGHEIGSIYEKRDFA